MKKWAILLILFVIVLGASSSAAQDSGEMRQLEGTITIALDGAVAAPGAEPTKLQESWQYIIEKYKEYQPNVEVIIQDNPPDIVSGEAYCQANIAGKSFPDIVFVDNCSLGIPSEAEVAAGTVLAVDFKEFAEEINPYSGKAWREDWANDGWRTSRCTQSSGSDNWTCFPDQLSQHGVWMNLDILQEYGYEGMPATYGELYELCDTINAAGKYVCWDDRVGAIDNFAWVAYTAVTMDRYEAAGGDIDDVPGTWRVVFGTPNFQAAYCRGEFSPVEHASIREALLQIQRFVDAHIPGGGAAFFDPTRDQTGQRFLAGQAAFKYESNRFWASILQAEQDGVLGVAKDRISATALPNFTTDDLIDKTQTIYYDGQPAMWGGGFGDMFAPISSIRTNGENADVDLIVRDFLQFLSSADGEQRILIQGSVPLNPDALENAEPAVKSWLTVKPEIWEGFPQPPASYSNGIMYTNDPSLAIHAWLAGQLDMETAMQTAYDNAVISTVQALEDNLEQFGLTELPEECKPFASS